MFERVLIAVDFSPCALNALALARRQFPAAQRQLLFVQDGSLMSTPEAFQDAFLGSHQLELAAQDARRQLESQCLPGERAEAVVGLPADEILSLACAWGADLIVLGTHGRRGLSHLVFGSVAVAVLRSATVPVLTVRQVQATRKTDAPDLIPGVEGVPTLPTGCRAPGRSR